MGKLLLELSLDQAHALRLALELYTRICLGQLEAVSHLVRNETLAVHADGDRTTAQLSVCDDVDRLMREAKTRLGFHPQSSFGIGHPHVHLTGKRAHEVDKVIAHALSVLRSPRTDAPSVDYDGLVVRYTADPAPRATVALE
jgi:hypothetical protein